MSNDGTEHRKLAAIMFTDMVGYSARVQEDEAAALELLEEHRQLLRAIFPKHQGAEIKTLGDGFLVEFASALAAVHCALEIQETIARQNSERAASRRFVLRIGIHLGDVVRREGDVFGDGVNIAARIEPLAEPGGVCISQQVFDQVQNKITNALAPLGRVELKNMPRPLETYRVLLSTNPAATVGGPRSAPSAEPDAAQQRSIAVLPFVNMSSDRENEFLSDGITEDLISALSQIKGLRVPARTSSFAFKGKNEDIRKIGKALSVTTVLEGSLRKAGKKLRVTAQLVNVADGYHLWSGKYDREMDDVFDIQDEITRAIVAALKVQLGEGDGSLLVRRPTSSTDAYQAYLQGRFLWNQRGAGLKKGLHHFELALLEDPNFALAYSGLADTFFLLAFYGYLAPGEANPRAFAAARKAIEIDGALPEGHTSMAVLYYFSDWNWLAAEKEYQAAVQLNPNYVPARYWHALDLSTRGRHEEALAEISYALKIDPLSFLVNAIHGWILFLAHQFGPAITQLRKALAMEPDFATTRWWLGRAYAAEARFAEALAEAEKAVELSAGAPWTLGGLGYVHALAGERDPAMKVLAHLRERARQSYVPAWFPALIHAGLGDKAKAFEWLNRACEERDMWLRWINCDGAYDQFHRDPRFQEILKRIGLGP